jgi:hypothetical protein
MQDRAEVSGSVGYEFPHLGNVVNTQSVRFFKQGAHRCSPDLCVAAVGDPVVLRVSANARYGKLVLNWACGARA